MGFDPAGISCLEYLGLRDTFGALRKDLEVYPRSWRKCGIGGDVPNHGWHEHRGC